MHFITSPPSVIIIQPPDPTKHHHTSPTSGPAAGIPHLLDNPSTLCWYQSVPVRTGLCCYLQHPPVRVTDRADNWCRSPTDRRGGGWIFPSVRPSKELFGMVMMTVPCGRRSLHPPLLNIELASNLNSPYPIARNLTAMMMSGGLPTFGGSTGAPPLL